MWLLFSILGMLFRVLFDVFSKKASTRDPKLAYIKLRVCVVSFCFLCAVVIWIFGMGESGLAPWEIVSRYPLIIFAQIFSFSSELLYLLSFRYMGLSVHEAFGGFTSVFLFVGMLLVNLLTGKLTAMGGLLDAWHLIPLFFMLLFAVLLPNANRIGKAALPESEVEKADRKKMILGFGVIGLAFVGDAGDTICTAVLLEDGIGILDFFCAMAFLSEFCCLLLFLYLWKKEKKPISVFSKEQGPLFAFSGLAFFAYGLLTILGASYNQVYSSLIWIAYPVFPMAASAIYLKERYTWKQSVCMYGMLIASFAFCIAEECL